MHSHETVTHLEICQNCRQVFHQSSRAEAEQLLTSKLHASATDSARAQSFAAHTQPNTLFIFESF